MRAHVVALLQCRRLLLVFHFINSSEGGSTVYTHSIYITPPAPRISLPHNPSRLIESVIYSATYVYLLIVISWCRKQGPPAGSLDVLYQTELLQTEPIWSVCCKHEGVFRYLKQWLVVCVMYTRTLGSHQNSILQPSSLCESLHPSAVADPEVLWSCCLNCLFHINRRSPKGKGGSGAPGSPHL